MDETVAYMMMPGSEDDEEEGGDGVADAGGGRAARQVTPLHGSRIFTCQTKTTFLFLFSINLGN